MNREHWKQMLPVIQAFVEGKTVQARYDDGDEWKSEPARPSFADTYQWRIKPTPRLRPWKPEEVPVGAVVRSKGDKRIRSVILGVFPEEEGGCVCLSCPGRKVECGLPYLLEAWNLDDGSPCGVVCDE